MARAVARFVGALLTGLCLAFSFVPVNAWYLAPIAVALFIWIVRKQRWWQTLIWGFVTGVVYSVATLYWLSPVGVDTVGMLGGLFGIWFALLAIGIRFVWRLPFAPVWVACLWVFIELGFSNVPLGGFGWLRLAFGQSDGVFLGFSRFIGVAGTCFFVVLLGALIVRIGERIAQRNGVDSRAWSLFWGLGSLVTAVVVVAIGGLLVVSVKLDMTYSSLTVAAVQGNVPGTGLNSLGEKTAVIRNHVTATKQLAQDVANGKATQPQLVVWPENSTDIDPLTNLDVRAQIDAAADAIKAPILVGAVRQNATNPPTLLNTGILWLPGTGAGEEYIKRHLVPFGEYMPMRGMVSRFTDRVRLVPNDFVSGSSPGVFTVDNVRVGDLICYEILSDSAVRSTVGEGVDMLVLQANNATYTHSGPGGLTEANQLLNIARVRAVESSRSIVVSTTNGVTALVDSQGKVVDQIPPLESGALVTEVPINTVEPLGIRVGQFVEYGLALLGLLAVVAGIVVFSRNKSE